MPDLFPAIHDVATFTIAPLFERPLGERGRFLRYGLEPADAADLRDRHHVAHGGLAVHATFDHRGAGGEDAVDDFVLDPKERAEVAFDCNDIEPKRYLIAQDHPVHIHI